MSGTRSDTQPAPVRIGISACLLGHHVRYDGRQKREPALAELLARVVEFVPVCPEVELGMGVPREPIELTRTEFGVRLLGVDSGTDHTDDMRAFAQRRLADLCEPSADQSDKVGSEIGNRTGSDARPPPISGYIFKSRSPSCGVRDTPILDRHGRVHSDSDRGLFARALTDRLPHLPVIDEFDARGPGALSHFLDRARAYDRLRRALPEPPTAGALVGFHSREKLLLMAHDQATYRKLGPLVANSGTAFKNSLTRRQLMADYRQGFFSALAKPASQGAHVNVLAHIAGYFKKQLTRDARAELTRAIGDYGAGFVPLTEVLDRLRVLARTWQMNYLLDQSYLAPHGHELLAAVES